MDDLRLITSNKGLHLAHLNVRSLANKIDLLRHLIFTSNLGILGLSETWLHEAIPDNMIDINGYTILKVHCQFPKRTFHSK